MIRSFDLEMLRVLARGVHREGSERRAIEMEVKLGLGTEIFDLFFEAASRSHHAGRPGRLSLGIRCN